MEDVSVTVPVSIVAIKTYQTRMKIWQFLHCSCVFGGNRSLVGLKSMHYGLDK